MAKSPEGNEQVLTALFGTVKSEERFPDMKCMKENGALGPGAIPWTLQLVDDMRALGETEEGFDLLENRRKMVVSIH